MEWMQRVRRLLFLGLGSAFLISMGGVGAAQADNGPHVSMTVGAGILGQTAGTDRCTSCHRVYTTQGASPVTTHQDGLCFTCHGPSAGGASTDVIDGVGYETSGTPNSDRSKAPGALRGGGFDYARIGSGTVTKETFLSGTSLGVRRQIIPALAAGKATTSNHGVAGVTGTARGDVAPYPGSGAAVTLECGSCHNPHGNGNYRILRPIPAHSGPSTPAVSVRIPEARVKVYTTTNYWLGGDPSVPPLVNGANIGTAASDGYIGNIAQWCTTCHTLHHNAAHDRMGGRNCVTCHVAHGSNASMSGARISQVERPDGSASSHGTSSRLLRVDNRATCTMCHNV
jgi:predicted CXXCH cytochrome family protein